MQQLNNDSGKGTTLPSILTIILKEVRRERRINQAQLAAACGKSPNAWTKIETGRTPITLDVLFQVSAALMIPPSLLITTAENYASLFSQSGWGIFKSLDLEEDNLFQKAQEFYKNESNQFNAISIPQMAHSAYHYSITSTPFYNQDGTIVIAPVFNYILSEIA